MARMDHFSFSENWFVSIRKQNGLGIKMVHFSKHDGLAVSDEFRGLAFFCPFLKFRRIRGARPNC
jgi:hypothetical protein